MKEEGRRKKEEGRRKKDGGMRRKEDGGGLYMGIVTPTPNEAPAEG